MALALLAIGVLMSGAGLYAVIFGYSIIQVEEGWASVISGATLIAGGVVTITLALILRTLNEVKAAFQSSPVKIQPEMAASPETQPPSVEVPISPIESLSDNAKRDKAEPAAPPPSSSLPSGETEEQPQAHAAPAVPDALPEHLAEPAAFHPSRQEEVYAPHVEPEPYLEAPRAADDYKLETPSTPEHDLPPITRDAPPTAPGPATPAQMDDWLDRAFAELDRDSPPLSPVLKPAPPPRPVLETASAEPPPPSHAAAAEAAQAPTSKDALQETPHEPGSTLAEEPQPLPPPTSAVIGRYESDGTLYVMYADGSIEAQSASGVYRFASMAELKAFIED